MPYIVLRSARNIRVVRTLAKLVLLEVSMKIYHSGISFVSAAAIFFLSAPCLGQASMASTGRAPLQEAWLAQMHAAKSDNAGCYAASFPSKVWTQVACQPVASTKRSPGIAAKQRGALQGVSATPRYLPATSAGPTDYALSSNTLIAQAVGTFPSTTNVTSVKSVGGIAGQNQYSIQLNTNGSGQTKPCAGRSGCASYLQFIYATGVSGSQANVFMQAWLINYNGVCPPGFPGSGKQQTCVYTTPGTPVPNLSITQLKNMQLTATATRGGNDVATFSVGGTAYRVSMSDATLDIASYWKNADFDVVGNAGGAQAVFNQGAAVTVKLAVTNGSTAAVTCVPNGSTTGETNNLKKGSCTVSGGSKPSLQYNEAS
jgi:hypothetical protein